MGRDKALLPFRGAPLGEAIARVVKAATGSVTIVGRSELGSFRAIPDRFPREGPLGGILTALDDAAADWNLIVACDMPGLSVEFLNSLCAAAEATTVDALIPRNPSGRPEPLCAVYRKKCLGPFEAAFARGVRKVMEAVGEVRSSLLPVAEVAAFQNVNTPEDWSGYAAD